MLTSPAWNTYWSPIFRSLTTQCLNPCREIRHEAFTSLQRALLSKDLASTDHKEWTAIFGEVLFPLITQLLKPEVYQSDPIGMSATRVQAATLICKIFLHYLVLLSEWAGMLDLWLRILGIMDRLMNSGQGDHLVSLISSSRSSSPWISFLFHQINRATPSSTSICSFSYSVKQEEAVSENLKNILLVMSTGGYLAPPEQKPDHEKLWVETWKRLDRFMPKLFAELFPEEANKPSQGRKSGVGGRSRPSAEIPASPSTVTDGDVANKG